MTALTRREVARTGFILGPHDRPRLLALFDRAERAEARLCEAMAALAEARRRLPDSGHDESCSLDLADAVNDPECDCSLGVLLERIDFLARSGQ